MTIAATRTLDTLAEQFGAKRETLELFGVECTPEAYHIPERDARGNTIGTSRRFDDGRKGFIKGGKRGLTMLWPMDANAGKTRSAPILVVEGFSDAVTGTERGFTTIGRPSATGGASHLKRVCRKRHVVIVAEHDESGAGKNGAEAIAQAIAKDAESVRILYPPEGVKDLREWCGGQYGADREELLAAIEGAQAVGLPSETEFSDTGNAARLVRLFGESLRYVPAWDKWLVYDGKRWAADERLQVRRFVRHAVAGIITEAQALGPGHERYKKLIEWGQRSADEPRMRRMLELAKDQLAITPAELDADPWLFNTLSGTIDLRTAELRPHDQADYITRLAPTEYSDTIDCPLWIATLDRIMAADAGLIQFLQRLLGMCLTGDISEQVLPVMHGVGANGKSLTVDTIAGLMGDYAAQAPPDLLMVRHGDEHPTEIADLFGRRLIIASETEEGRKLRIQLVKKLTGDATLKGRYMRQDYFEFPRTHKTLLVTNNAPVVTEASNAIWRRLKLVPFDVVIPPEEQDRDLLAKLRGERPGILAWLLKGCVEWQLDGLRVPDRVTTATAEYRDEQDVLAPFIDERCLLSEACRVTRSDLWAEWQTWVEKTRDRSRLARNGFYDRVRMLPGVADDSFTSNGRTCRGFKGLGLCG